jgi:hypothetical protein
VWLGVPTLRPELPSGVASLFPKDAMRGTSPSSEWTPIEAWSPTGRMVVASLAAACLLLIGLQTQYWAWTSDDAYITFRYAENLASGLGVVFNPGERVEGYSNFLWMVLLAAVHWTGVDTVIAAKVMGAVLSLITLGLTAGVATFLAGGRRTVATLAAPVLVASSFSYVGWSVAGLETSLFAFLVTASLWRFAVERELREPFPWSAVLLTLTGLTRPEGVLIIAVVFAFVMTDSVRSPAGSPTRRWAARFVTLCLAMAVPYMAWRVWYFGYLFPNTFYVKGGRGPVQWLAGVLYVTSGIRNHGGMLMHVLAVAAAFFGPSRRRAAPFVAALVTWQVYDVYKGNDVLELFRFFVPILPMLFALAMVALVRGYDAVRAQFRSPVVPAAALSLFVLGTVATNVVLVYLGRDYRLQLREYQVQIRIDAREFARYADRLKAIAPDGASIAVVDAGAIPYLTGWYTLDRWGLCDVHIAHLPPRGPNGEKFDAAYVLARHPTFIQTKVLDGMEDRASLVPWWPGDVELFASPEFRRQYTRIEDPVLNGFYVRRDAMSRLALAR